MFPSPNTFLRKAFNHLKPPPGESPCMGIALGRRFLWALQASGGSMRPDGLRPVEWARQVPLDFPLFEGEPSGETGSLLAQALAPLFEKAKKTYCTFQVALPDPLVKFEVFEMDKVPPRGKAMEEFLAWRFNQDLNKEETRPPLAFASQLLGEEDGKSLVLAMGGEKNCLLA